MSDPHPQDAVPPAWREPLIQAIELEQSGATLEALTLLTPHAATAEAQGQPDFCLKFAALLSLQGRDQEALAFLRNARSTCGELPWLNHALGCLELRLSLEEAVNSLQRATEGDSSNYWSHYMLGEALAAQGRFRDALGPFAKAVEIDPTLPWAHFARGRAFTELGSLKAAVSEIQEAAERGMDPAKVAPALERIDSLRRQNALKSGLTEVTDGSFDHSPAFWMKKAEDAVAANNLDEAGVLVDRALACDPSVVHAWVMKGVILRRCNRTADALPLFLRALDLAQPPSASTLFHTAESLRALGRGDEAVAMYKRVLRLDPQHKPTLDSLAGWGPRGAQLLREREAGLRSIKVGSFVTHLLLDGHGPRFEHDPAGRLKHPYFGKAPFNVGDQFVALALAKVLRISEFYSVNPVAPQRDFDRINSECEVFLIRGSNFIYPGFFAANFNREILSKIKIPIVYVGAGIQFRTGEEFRLLPEDVDCLKYIHDSAPSSSVRGYRCAELLHRYGIKNVRATGCPTILWGLNPNLQVRRPSLDRVAWTMTDFAFDPPAEVHQWQQIASLLAAAKRVHVAAQGGEVMLQEWIAHRDSLALCNRHDTACGDFLTHSRIEEPTENVLLSTVRHRYRHAPESVLQSLLDESYFAYGVHDYLRFMKEMSLVIGTRLHGNVMALAQGIPAVFCLHDARIADMAELLRAPTFDLTNAVDFGKQTWDWKPFTDNFPSLFKNFIDFFEENQLPHNLRV